MSVEANLLGPTAGPTEATRAPDATRDRRRWILIAGLSGLLVAAAIVFPVLAPYGAEQVFRGAQLEPPSSEHLFGTDINRMDILSRVLVATRVDLGIVFISTAVAFLIGFPLGVLSGYYGGVGTGIFLRLLDMVQAFPMLVMALVIVALLGPGADNVIFAQIFVGTPIMVRVVRSEAVRLREERFVEAAVAAGNSDARLLLRHVAPHALPIALIQTTNLMAGALILTTGLSFIGVGVAPPTAEWGSMVGLGSSDIANGDWWTIVFPGAAIALSVVAFTVLSMLLRRQFPDGQR